MEFVEPEDEHNPFRRPLPPDDRLWRHPSEWNDLPPVPVTPRRVWPVALASAVTGSVLSAGLVIALSGLLPSGSRGPAVIQQMVTPVPASTSTGEGTPESRGPDDPVVAITERVAPAIVQVRVGSSRDQKGSGVIFRSDGHVLTSAHVVDKAGDITVVLATGRSVSGRALGIDTDTDTAVVKIDGGPFPIATMGTASALRVGQRAVAVGSPLRTGRGPSVTVGVVSALHRHVRAGRGGRTLFDLVQTDAPLPPGATGGPLLDSAGNVVGITTAIADEPGTGGFGFATPIDAAWAASEQLIDKGRVTAVWLGVQGADVDEATAVQLDVDGGAQVVEVTEGSPAARSGMALHDVIVALDGKPITSMGELVVALRSKKPGDAVTVSYLRGGERRTARPVLAERPAT